MPVRWLEGEVISIRQIGRKTKHFDIKIMEHGEEVEFSPGQFVTFDLPIGEKRLDRWRSYSIASPDIVDGVFSLCIVHLEGGKASTFFNHTVAVGDKLLFKKPQGTFTLPSQSTRPITFICTGTGVAPFRSMIHHLFKEKYDGELHLIFGTRYEEDILYRDEFETLASIHPNFQYDVALSRATSWSGHKGYVHRIYEDHLDLSEERLYYICGWSMMVDEAKERLIKLGVPSNHIIIELYG